MKHILSGDVVDDDFGLFLDEFEIDNITPKKVSKMISNYKDGDVVELTTYGGLVDAGISIYDMIKNSGKKIAAYIPSYAVSAGTFISSAFDKVELSENAFFMIHQAAYSNLYSSGRITTEFLDELLHNLSITNDAILNIYRNKTGLSKEAIKKDFMNEKAFFPEYALKMKYVDSIKTFSNASGEKSKINIEDFSMLANAKNEELEDNFKKYKENKDVEKDKNEPEAEVLDKKEIIKEVKAYDFSELEKSLSEMNASFSAVSEKIDMIFEKIEEKKDGTSQYTENPKQENVKTKENILNKLKQKDENKFAVNSSGFVIL